MFARITKDPIDLAGILDQVGSEQDGAVLLFVGIVRNHNDGRAVTGVRYEAYEEMAEKTLLDIAEEVAETYGSDRVAVIHRVGDLVIGEASVAIAVSSPHRSESFDASRYVIEEIKKRLPVWKHERYADGTVEWVEGHMPAVTQGGDA